MCVSLADFGVIDGLICVFRSRCVLSIQTMMVLSCLLWAVCVLVWLSLLLLQPGVQAMLQTGLCICFGFVHLVVRPLRTREVHTLQVTLQLCLAMMAVSGTPFAEATERAVAEASSSVGGGVRWASDVFAGVLGEVFGVVVPLVALAWAFGGGKAAHVARSVVERLRHGRGRRAAHV